MKSLIIILLFVATAQAKYLPLHQAQPELFHNIKSSDRVLLPGALSQPEELLQKTLRKRYRRTFAKNPKLLVSKAIPKMLSDSKSRAISRGFYAEYRYALNNPSAGLVSVHNAKHNDLYLRPIGQRPPVGIQVKTLSGGPAAYARAMRADHKARYFLVPDDHVKSLKALWIYKAERYASKGQSVRAGKAYAQANRVQPLGATMNGLDKEMRRAGEKIVARSNSKYAATGAAMGLSLIPSIVDIAKDGELSEQGKQQLASTLVFAGTLGTTQLTLAKYKEGKLLNTPKGNVILTGVALATNVGIELYRHGGISAFQNLEFSLSVFASTTAIGAGTYVGTTAGAAAAIGATATGFLAPAAPYIGGVTTVVVGAVTTYLVDLGISKIGKWALRSYAPELLYPVNTKGFEFESFQLESKIKQLQILR
jgi:hypothetical protein